MSFGGEMTVHVTESRTFREMAKQTIESHKQFQATLTVGHNVEDDWMFTDKEVPVIDDRYYFILHRSLTGIRGTAYTCVTMSVDGVDLAVLQHLRIEDGEDNLEKGLRRLKRFQEIPPEQRLVLQFS